MADPVEDRAARSRPDRLEVVLNRLLPGYLAAVLVGVLAIPLLLMAQEMLERGATNLSFEAAVLFICLMTIIGFVPAAVLGLPPAALLLYLLTRWGAGRFWAYCLAGGIVPSLMVGELKLLDSAWNVISWGDWIIIEDFLLPATLAGPLAGAIYWRIVVGNQENT